MTRLACPFCGPRDLAEFSFHKTLPDAGTSGYVAVYERTASTERSLEHWQHAGGCRAWLRVLRNPSTGAVLECRLEAEGGP